MWCQMTNVPECRNIIGLKPFGSKCIGTETHQYLSGVKYKRFDDRDKDRWKRSTRKFREDGEDYTSLLIGSIFLQNNVQRKWRASLCWKPSTRHKGEGHWGFVLQVWKNCLCRLENKARAAILFCWIRGPKVKFTSYIRFTNDK